MELQEYLTKIKEYNLTDSEKESLAKSAEAFDCATDRKSLEMYYKLSLYASLLDGLLPDK